MSICPLSCETDDRLLSADQTISPRLMLTTESRNH